MSSETARGMLALQCVWSSHVDYQPTNTHERFADVDAKTKADGYPHDFIIQSQPAGRDGDGLQPVYYYIIFFYYNFYYYYYYCYYLNKDNDKVGNIGINVTISIHVIIRIQFKLFKFYLKYILQYILVGLNQNCLSCVISTSLFYIIVVFI